ncbi:MAG: hypothetical protein EOP02_00580 [Proteobacteria bacterium]|nr:MAG: hypothetical protein EOP02_00580 [Pseudomonadota bacterium]
MKKQPNLFTKKFNMENSKVSCPVFSSSESADPPHDAPSEPWPYELNLAERARFRQGRFYNDNGTLNTLLICHNQGLALCTPTDDSDPNWLDAVDTQTLMIIEDFVNMVCRYDYVAWYTLREDGRGQPLPSMVGDICRHYLPLLAHLDLFRFPKKGVIYSNRFYALLLAYVQVRDEGLCNTTGIFENPLSLRCRWHVQNALIAYVRVHLQRENSSFSTPLPSVRL